VRGNGVCTIHLLRHAEHGLLGHSLAGRTAGVPLSSTGVAQSQALARHYTGQDIRAVLTSPVQRAQDTAQPIASALGLVPLIESGLEEIDFGAWSGAEFAALAAQPGWAAWNTARSLAPTPGGETMLMAQARAVSALMRQRDLGATVIAVSHSDVIKAVLAYILGMPLDLLHRLEIAPASRSIVVIGDDFARVEAVNLPP
jgi:broad specificity phosphatase PhoE